MIHYITQTYLNGLNAQSVQIRKTVEALHQSCDVTLISPACNLRDELACNWTKVPLILTVGKAKYLNFLLQLIISYRSPKKVYTRDVLVAALYIILGAQVIYEAHQRPSSSVNYILKYLKSSQRFRVVTISNALMKYYIARYNLESDQIFLIRSAVDYEKYQNIQVSKERLNNFLIGEGQKVLLHSGSIGLGRGTEIFSDILNRFPEITVLQIGGSARELLSLDNLINNKRFISIPRIDKEDELIALQHCADVCLFPMTDKVETAWCCSPMKIFEYAALGKPLVATTVGAVGELINEENAFVFEPGCSNSLVEALELALINDGVSSAKVQKLRSLASNNTWKLRAVAIRDLFS